MSTDIKPGQIWAADSGTRRVEVLAADLPDRIDYQDVADDDGPFTRNEEQFRAVFTYVSEGGPDVSPFPSPTTTPAPLDPSKVQAGDTVTVEVGPNDAAPKPFSITGEAYASDWGNEYPLAVGGYLIGHHNTTLTEHQPAPKPEWKPGTTGTATAVFSGGNHDQATARRVFRTAGVVAPGETTKPWVDEFGNVLADDAITDFVPDETRPLPTRGELWDMVANHLPDTAMSYQEELVDAVMALLRGESR